MKSEREAAGASMRPWRDRPLGGASDEDRAAALTRDALAPGAMPLGLDSRQIERIARNLEPRPDRAGWRRPRPWMRLAFAVLLLVASVASVKGYQSGWFAPIGARLRFRTIPSVAPEEAPRRQTRPAPRPAVTQPTAPVTANDAPPPIETSASAPSPAVAVLAPPHAMVAAAARKTVRMEPAVPAPSPPPAISPVAAAPQEPPEEIRALERAMILLRVKHDAAGALAALDDYIARFPAGVLGPEARVGRVDALLMLNRSDEALRALERMPLDGHRRSTELQLIRAELRASSDCGRAEADFTAVLARARTAALEERALMGRASCRSRRGDARAAAADLRRYVERFPDGARTSWARRWLEKND